MAPISGAARCASEQPMGARPPTSGHRLEGRPMSLMLAARLAARFHTVHRLTADQRLWTRTPLPSRVHLGDLLRPCALRRASIGRLHAPRTHRQRGPGPLQSSRRSVLPQRHRVRPCGATSPTRRGGVIAPLPARRATSSSHQGRATSRVHSHLSLAAQTHWLNASGRASHVRPLASKDTPAHRDRQVCAS